MALPRIPTFTFNHVDQPDKLSGDPVGNKEKFDSRSKTVRDALNNSILPEVETQLTGAVNIANTAQTGVQDITDNHINKATGAHIASSVSITDSGNNFASSDVEGALTELFTSVSSGKNTVATAITDKGVPTSGSDTFSKMATNIRSIPTGVDTSDGTAIVADILSTKTAYVNGSKITGSMPNNGAYNITPGTANITIPTGYHNGGVVYGDSDLIAGNIKTGVNIFGVVGTLSGASLKSILTGRVSLSTTNRTINVPISSVNMSKSIVLFSYSGNPGGLRVTLTSSNNLEVYKGYNGDAGGYVSWFVIEFNDGVSVQRGVTAASKYNANVTIGSVDTTRSFALVSLSYDSTSTTYEGNTVCETYLSSSTSLAIVKSSQDLTTIFSWQVITFV